MKAVVSIVLISILVVCDSAYAQSPTVIPGQWVSIGPDGGTVRALAVDPTNPAIVYAGTASGGVYKSTDAGGHWSAVNAGFYAGVRKTALVNALAIDPVTTTTVYAATTDGVFKSADGGNSWNAVVIVSQVLALAIDPKSRTTLYAGTQEDGILKITSGSVVSGLPNAGAVRVLAVNPVTPTIVYAATASGVFKSMDGGGTWSDAGLAGYDIYMLAIDARNPSILYASGSSYRDCYWVDWEEVCFGGPDLFKSADGGNTWGSAGGEPNGNFVNALAIDPFNSNTLYAGTEGGVFKSTDAGGSWSILAATLSPASGFALVLTPTTPNVIYVGVNERGVFKSTDGGNTWNSATLGLAATIVGAFVIDPRTPTTLYAAPTPLYGARRTGILKSTDAGRTWREVNTGLTSYYIYALAIDPQTPTTLYAAADAFPSASGYTFFKSTDGAASWTRVSSSVISASTRALIVDPITPTTLYAASYVGVFKSVDGGASWTDPRVRMDVLSVAIDPLTPATLYAGTYGGGLFKTTDGGDTWIVVGDQRSGVTSDIQAVAIDPGSPATVYLGTGDGVVKSTDGGATWTHTSTGLASLRIVALAVDPRTPSTLYAATLASADTILYGRVFKSQDGGENWASRGLASVSIRSLAFDSASPTTVYAATDGNGVFATSGDEVPGNIPPAAAFTFACNAFTCTFDGSGSFDPDGTIATYVWNFGDGRVASGPKANHTYAAAGVYSSSLTVTDNSGGANTQTSNVTIHQPGIHVGDIDGNRTIQQNTWTATITLTVHDSTHSPLPNATVSISWNDGTTGTCWSTTNVAGRCVVTKADIPRKTNTVSLNVTNVARLGFDYHPSENHDPDGDSNGTTIIFR